MPQFGSVSKQHLATCHHDLQLILNEAIANCSVDFGISEGHRSIADQQKYFKEGKSKVDGIKVKGKHNHTPSLAADIYLWIKGKAVWNNESLSYVAGYIEATANHLYNIGTVDHLIRWGGNWNRDGEILTDQSFDDRPHFELFKP